MRHSISRLLGLAAIAAVIALAAAALVPPTTEAASGPVSQPSASASWWYGGCTYVVRPGDNLYHISVRHGVSPYSMAMGNGIYNPNFVYRGMVLRVPCANTYSQPYVRPSVYPSYSSGNQSYGYSNKPQQGYTNSYSQSYSNSYSSTSYSACSVHIVRRGEWLALISREFGVSWPAIAAVNHLYNPNIIFVGMRLLIPCAQSYAPYSAPSSGYQAPSSSYQPSPSTYPTPSAGGTTAPPTAGNVAAMMMNIMFSPATINVHVGQSVTWHNMDSVQHSATQGTCSGSTCLPAAGGFDTGILNPGQTSAAITFNTAGTFHFYCRVHGAMMQGDVVVSP